MIRFADILISTLTLGFTALGLYVAVIAATPEEHSVGVFIAACSFIGFLAHQSNKGSRK